MHGAAFLSPSIQDPNRIGSGEILRILRRRRLLILLIVGVSVGLSVLWLRSTPPLYTATAVLKVATVDPEAQAPGTVLSAAQDELRISTVLELLQSKDLAQQVVGDLQLYNDSEFSAAAAKKPGVIAFLSRVLLGQKDPDYSKQFDEDDLAEIEADKQTVAVIERLLDRIQIERIDQSPLIEVSATVSDPVKAVRIANAFATTYVEHQTKAKWKRNRTAIEELSERVADLRGRMQIAENAIASYERSRDLPAGGNQETAATDMSRLGGQLADTRADRAAAEIRFRGLRSDVSSGGAAASVSPLLTSLRTREAELRTKIAQLTAHYGQGHPDVVAATAELQDIQGGIAEEIGRVGKDLRNAIAVQQARESQLASEIGAIRARAFRQGSAAVGLMALQRDAETTRTLYMAQLAELKALEARSHSISADASMASHARYPTEPSYPRPKEVIGVSAAGSCMLALLIAFVAHMADQRIRTADQIETLFGLRTLAMLPMVWRREGGGPHNELIERPCSVFSETVRSLYLELASLRSPPPQIVVVTSALPGEGKTAVAISLAAAAASHGTSSVVVELDLRRPGLLKALELPAGSPGILDYLSGHATIDDILVRDDRLPGLMSISTDRPSSDPGAALSSPPITTLLAELRKRFTLIVLNAPPILPVRDPKTLAEMADAALFVVPWGANVDAVRAAVRALRNRIAGVVINKVNFRKHAKQAYGDAIQHYGQYSTYYLSDERSDERGRNSAGRMDAEARPHSDHVE